MIIGYVLPIMGKGKSFAIILTGILTCFIIYNVYENHTLNNKLSSFRKNTFQILQRYEAQNKELQGLIEEMLQIRIFPSQLQNIPHADEEGALLSVHDIEIPDVKAPYNASILKQGDYYSLFFRYDIPVSGEKVPFHSYVGCAQFDKDFSLVRPYLTFDTLSNYSEDARAIAIDDQNLIIYNDSIGNHKGRGIRKAQIDIETGQVESILCFKQINFNIEKNWIPFAPDGKTLHLIYSISPHKVLKLLSPDKPVLEPVAQPDEMSILSFADWPKQWGYPKGGTPPQLVDGEYLSFFHSSFTDSKGIVWYIMGAYTFEPQAPYRITKISKYPILFNNAYSTPHQNTAPKNVRSLYPAGLVLENRDGKGLIHLSCGENDSTVKILTFDKEAFMKTLKPVSPHTQITSGDLTDCWFLSARSKKMLVQKECK